MNKIWQVKEESVTQYLASVLELILQNEYSPQAYSNFLGRLHTYLKNVYILFIRKYISSLDSSTLF